MFERTDIDISAVEDNFINTDTWKLCSTTHGWETSFRTYFLLNSPYFNK